MPLQDYINSIVETRQTYTEEFRLKLNAAVSWKRWVDSVLAFTKENSTYWDAIIQDSPDSTQNKWADLKNELETLQKKLNNAICNDADCEGDLVAAYNRTSRHFLNLGCIGPWRRGKSEVIAKLTQLDTWIVPTSKLDKCTGTTINIVNAPYVEVTSSGEQVEINDIALIHHYSVAEIVSLLNSYFKILHINANCSAKTKAELTQFCQNRSYKNLIHSTTDNPPAGQKGLCDTLRNYIDNIDKYVDLLDGEIEKIPDILSTESKKKYRPCVSYRATPDGDNSCYQVLATKKAVVYTHFTLIGEEVGKIQIVDTPGIGEERIGVDEALGEALTKDLDIAIALAKVATATDDEGLVTRFHELLKLKISNRNPQSWLFYLFNLWNTQELDKSIVENIKSTVLSNLKTPVQKDGKMFSGIDLDLSHIEFIDCKNDNPLVCYDVDGSLKMSEDRGISPFIYRILQIMVNSIEDVDTVFFSQARTLYSELKQQYEELHHQVKALPIAKYDTHSVIDSHIKSLAKNLKSIPFVDLVEKIGNNVADLQKEWTGKSVATSILLADENAKDTIDSTLKDIEQKVTNLKDEDAIASALAKSLKDQFTTLYQLEGQYCNNNEFKTYTEIKKRLFEDMRDDISSRINETDCINKLKESKDKYADCLLKDGLFSMILPNTTKDSFWDDVNEFLEQAGGSYESLKTCFADFNGFKITIQNKIAQDLLTSTLGYCLHSDDFGKRGFLTYDCALRSLIHSLISVEAAIKDAISESDSTISTMIKSQKDNYTKACTLLCEITNRNEHDSNPSYNDLYLLYQDYQDKFFKNDEQTKKQGVVERWHKL